MGACRWSALACAVLGVAVLAVPHDLKAGRTNAGVSGDSTPLSCAADQQDVQTADSCNVCLACCNAQYNTTESCSDCVQQHCQPAPWPGTDLTKPRVHYSMNCIRAGGWHDVAAAITHKGKHHVFMGCYTIMGGWGHGVSSDLVHWDNIRGAPRRSEETYAGMHSFVTPCSGFITKDEAGIPCAGFRQCGSDRGINKTGAHSWDVPLEVRCAYDDMLSEWDRAEYLFNVSFWRSIPYDPARPWKDTDGNWYMLLSMDGCNATGPSRREVHSPEDHACAAGGRLEMWTSPYLRGPYAEWTHVGPMFQDNATVIKDGYLTREFVTIDYVGGFAGDPNGGATRVFFDNTGGNGGGVNCCGGTTSYRIGTQKAGGQFIQSKIGMVDWGAFYPRPDMSDQRGVDALKGDGPRGYSMARTLGTEDANQVANTGRRVMLGWVSGVGASSMSIARDLTLAGESDDVELLQQFVPELQVLRQTDEPAAAARIHSPADLHQSTLYTPSVGDDTSTGLRVEIVANFVIPGGAAPASGGEPPAEGFGVAVLGSANGMFKTKIGVEPQSGLVIVDGMELGNDRIRAGPLMPQNSTEVTMHIIVDHSLIEVIVNNRTALTVTVTPVCETCGAVWLYGVDGDSVTGDYQMWHLDAANNVV